MEDKRFAHIAQDPKFRRIPKGEKKVKIDKRFQSMFKDKKFKVKYTTDKRGRPVNHSTTEDLRRYYELSSEDESDSEPEEDDAGKFVRAPSNDEDEEVKVQSTDKVLSEDVKKKLKNLNVDYARGEGNLLSESSSDEDESEGEVSDVESVDHKWGELDGDAERTDDVTYRLAVCNMDWDRIRAVDLMVLFNSFLPSGGLIKSVQIYTSEFGKQRLAEEEITGPTELVAPKEEDIEENEEGAKYHMEKLRTYQLNRLKYFYAVISCDSANTANKIYTECDGMEYESTATKIDLRFVPDEMVFDDEPKEMCDKLPELNKYQPRNFVTAALQQAKVNLTWDETNPARVEMAEKLATGKIDDVSEVDLQAYLASSSGEDDSDEEIKNDLDEDNGKNPIDKYKALLEEIESKEKEKENKDVQMEISWGIDLESKTEKLVKKKLESNENKTPFQQYLDKRKEKLKQKKEAKKNNNDNASDSDIPSDVDMNDKYFAEEFDKPEFKKPKHVSESESEDTGNEAELQLLLNEDDDKQHFSLKGIQDQEDESKSKKKRRKRAKEEVKKDDDFQVNVNDDRFSALFTSHHYNIDPTDPHYKKTKNMEKLIGEKIKRRTDDDSVTTVKKTKQGNKNAELNVLVKSVKRKAHAFSNKSKRN